MEAPPQQQQQQQAGADEGGGGDADTFRFLVTTDNHLGYMERDPRRGDDSFVTFEEALRVGRVEYDCDAALLGGDLFHENKPSLGCMTRTLALFRKYVMGSRPISFQLRSNPATTFPTHPNPIANFQDPNLNIAMPVFTIHGNHDDPVGGVSAIDTLATAGVVNYFGHTADVEEILVRPVLLQKGNTYVAVYGLGNVRDERLHRCFTLGKVRFVRPREDAARWFSILLLHQNRGCRAGKGGIMEDMLRGFGMDLVIWGNEHEQRMVPSAVDATLEIIQPGSTVMTSLGSGESNPKQCGILEINGTAYRLTPHTLRSVRPVVRRGLELWREPGLASKTADAVEEFLRKVAEDMLSEAEEKIHRIPDDVLRQHAFLKYPLLRLSVDFADPQGAAPYPCPNMVRFGQQYLDVVVNAADMLKAVKPKASGSRAGAAALAAQLKDPDARPLDGILAPADDDGSSGGGAGRDPLVTTGDIRTKIAQVFSANATDGCKLLSEPEVTHAVQSFVEKSERAAIEETVEALLQGCQRNIWKNVREKADDVSRTAVVELSVANKKDRNRRYFEKYDQHQHNDATSTAALNLPPLPPPPLGASNVGTAAPAPLAVVAAAGDDDGDDDEEHENAYRGMGQQQLGLRGDGFLDLASRSALAIGAHPLGAPPPLPPAPPAVVRLDDDDDEEHENNNGQGGVVPRPPAAALPGSAAAIVADHQGAELPPGVPTPPAVTSKGKARGSKAKSAPGGKGASSAPAGKKRSKAPAAGASDSKQPSRGQPRGTTPPPPAQLELSTNPAAALMAKWSAAPPSGTTR